MSNRPLPTHRGDLAGLRVRRYVRVSSEEQGRKYGPDGQHERIDEAIAELGLKEVGPPFVDEHSAWARSDERPELARILAEAAAGSFDVLVVAYFSRWSRDTEVALRMRRQLHDAGVVLWFGDEGFLSSDRDAHERFLDEAVGAEKFSHRLSRTISRTLAAKYERYGDQAGSPGLGFRRTPQPEARLAIDPATMPRVVAMFERYATGDVSYRDLEREFGIAEGGVRAILSNPLYNGWAVRHRRRPDEVRIAAPWRSAPPVPDELWSRVVEVRRMRTLNAGRSRARRTYLLAKRLWCACGHAIAADTAQQRNGSQLRRYRHEDCPLGGKVTWKAEHYEEPIAAQVAAIRLDESALERIRRIAGRPAPVTTDLRRAQLERELRAKATDHAARRITTEAYLAEHARITGEIDGLVAVPVAAPIDDADEVIARLRELRTTWARATDEARAALVARIYRRITVAGGDFASVELTEEAKRLGLALVMPETVVLARPARLELTAFRSAT